MDINLLIDEIKEQGSEFKKAFTKLIIFTSKEVISGAPMMFLKGKAKELIKKELPDLSLLGKYYEIDLILGLMISYSSLSLEEKYRLIDIYLLSADNWADIDTLSSSFKTKNYDLALKYIKKCLISPYPFIRRFGYIHFLSNFVKPLYVKDIFALIKNDEEYYVKMAIAWLLSVAFIKCKEETITYLKNCDLDNATINMFVRKVLDSKRVSLTDKEFIKTLKK